MQRSHKDLQRFVLFCCAVCAAALLSGGCGSSGSTAPIGGSYGLVASGGGILPTPTPTPTPVVPQGTGRLVLSLDWPAAASRVIPDAAQSVEIRILDGDTVIATRVVTPSEREVTFENLPAKKLTVVLRAFPNADATGVVLAEGRLEVEVKSGQTTSVAVAPSLQSTIDRLVVDPQSATVNVGSTVALNVSARNQAGEVVMVRSDRLRFVSFSSEIATVSNTGTVTGVSEGTATIEVTEADSGKKATVSVKVDASQKIVFSDVSANITSTDFSPLTFTTVDADDFTDRNDVFIPNITYTGVTEVNTSEGGSITSTFARRLSATLPPGLAVGQTQNVTYSASNPYYVQYLETVSGSGRRVERRFFSTGGGTVTFVRRDGDRYTLRFSNVRLEALSVDGSVATGRATINGTLTFVDDDPNDDNTDPHD